jgi:predicted alpha/beta hydrolase family esterase
MPQILIIHGGDAFQSYEEYLHDLKNKEFILERIKIQDWKSAIDKKLGEHYEVLAPRMPNAQNAKYQEWKIWFEKIIPLLNDNLILIGHSLGGIFLAKYLAEENISKRIRAMFLIAAPFVAPNQTHLGDFTLPASLQKLINQGGDIFLYHSRDDEVVPFADCEKYQKALPQAHARLFTNRQHFNQVELPEIIEDITKL